ncbi:hypothetical protein NHX12_002550 [Muraenolepis orangiensis]|uniref:Uncharacterized protein n=1 Tax=Muraenolepis orangiensis TaxID=630683 RepID=A0A9Q0IGH9_9TELE|nr:hypothetical protein NHX12_002550 [Muraenolepis orangiensis]
MEARQQYTLKEPWRLRVASAQAYSIIKRRDVGRYERMISFLDASYRLLPTLVVTIKHMKILFGLKTGLLQKQRPVSYEDKLLFEIIAQDSPIAVSLKRLLRQGDKGCLMGAAVDDISRAPPRSETATAPEVVLQDATQEPKATCPHLHEDSPLLFDEECSTGGCEVRCSTPKDGLVKETVEAGMKGDRSYRKKGSVNLLEQAVGDCCHREEESLEEEQLSQRSSDSERVAAASSSSPLLQFCSKHQRWVRSILSECSEEQQTQSKVASAPSHFLVPSPQDLVPSDLAPCALAPSDLVPSDLVPSDLAPSDLTPSDLTPSDLIPSDLIQKPATSQTSSLNQATTQEPDQTPPMHHRTSGPAEKRVADGIGTQSAHPVCSSQDLSVATATPNPSHYMAPFNLPHTPVCEPSTPQYCHKSKNVSTFSSLKPEVPWDSSDLKHRLTAGLLPGGAQPLSAPAIAVPVSEPHEQALAQTQPAHYQQNVRVSRSSSHSALCLASTLHPFAGLSRNCGQTPVAPVPLSCVTVRERRGRLSRSSRQKSAFFHPAPPDSSKDSLELASASVSVLSPVLVISRCLLPPGSQSTLAGTICAVTAKPSLSVSAQDLHAPSQFRLPLQPYVRLSRLHPQQYLRETGHRFPPSTETQLVEKQASDAEGDPDEGRGEEEEQEEGGRGGAEKLLYSDFDPNLLFSSDDSSGSDSGNFQDPDYIPSKP